MRSLLLSLLLIFPGSLFASVDPALLAMVPAKSKLITGLDADRARASSFGQYMLSRINKDDSEFQQFVDETGFDPRRDLQSFVFATCGDSKRNGQFVIFARGIFDTDRIKTAARAHGAVVQNYAGADLYVDQKRNPATAFTFLDATTAALADLGTLKQVLDNRNTPPELDPALQLQVKQANEANDVWFVSGLPPSLLASHLHQETGEAPDGAGALRGIVQSRGGIQFGDAVRLSFDAVTRSPQDATSLTDVLRFLASAVQMERNRDPRAAVLANSFDSMALDSSGSNVHVGLSLSEANLERLIDLGPRPKESAQSRPARRLQ